jgi:hypothetical protein
LPGGTSPRQLLPCCVRSNQGYLSADSRHVRSAG